MSEETKAFIDKLADGDNAGAGEAFKDALRVKVGSQLDQARKDMAGNLFNGNIEAEPHSDPKPEIAGTGTFTPDGQVEPTGKEAIAQAETQPETPEVSDAESQPASTEQPGV